MNGANLIAGLWKDGIFWAANLSQQQDSDNSIKKTNQLNFGPGVSRERLEYGSIQAFERVLGTDYVVKVN